MAKSPGMGHRLFIDGYDVASDVSSVSNLSVPMTVQTVTGIDKYAIERIGLLHDCTAEFGHYWNPTNVAGDAIHLVLKGLPRTDRQVSYLAGTTAGAPMLSLVSKQVNYDWTRGTDGSMTGTTSCQGNAYGGAWGVSMTAGKRTEATAGNVASVDLGTLPVSYSFGWSAYLHVFAFTGTSITVKIQDSADNATFADVTSAAFTAATAIGVQRIGTAAGSPATVRRYVRLVTTGTYSNATYAVNFVRNEAAGYPS